MFGIDISNIQRTINLNKKVDIDFVICKATEGTTFSDATFNFYVDKLVSLGLQIGCYHFARPDIHGSYEELKKEAEHFVDTVERAGLIGTALLILDWEKQPIEREDLIYSWVNRVKSLSGIQPFIYCNRYHYNLIKNYNVVKQCPLWLASWPTIEKIEAGTVPYGVKFPQGEEWVIWQYSSNGVWPDYSGKVDLDYTSISSLEWKQFASGQIIENEEQLSSDMIWAIQQGIFKGYKDGSYKPSQFLTREQAASLTHRLYEIMIRDFGE